MKSRSIVGLALPGVLAFGAPALGQPATPIALAPAMAAARHQYAASFGTHPELYNGPEYLDYSRRYHTVKGHQFFLSTAPQPGAVAYNGHDFQNISLAYDVVLDHVVLSPPQSPLTLRLLDEKVRGFTISGHRFVRLAADSATRSIIRTGYYEELLGGPVQVLARRMKTQQEHISQAHVDVEFTAVDKLFVRKAGQYYAVSSKSSVLRLMADRGKEVQKYAQEHKLRFNKAQREASVLALATYYASLPPL
jgi:hypothetical protein